MCSWQSDQEADGAAELPIPAEERCLVDLHAGDFPWLYSGTWGEAHVQTSISG